ncbi:MAG TPA: hypothetical protein VFX59_04820, partial [Polyangiales bacterium]|nr:hypothetical protein [Polyangiales bacterium]
GELLDELREDDFLSAGLTPPSQGRSLLVAKLSSDGALRWNRLYALAREHPEYTLAFDPTGNLWVRYLQYVTDYPSSSTATLVLAADGTELPAWPAEPLSPGTLSFVDSDVVHTYYGSTLPGRPDSSSGGDWTARRAADAKTRWRFASTGRFSGDARRSVSVGPTGRVAIGTWQQFQPNPRIEVATLDN